MDFLAAPRFPVVSALPAASANTGRVLEQGSKPWFSNGTSWIDLTGAIPSNMMTTDTAQTVSGVKTFNASPLVPTAATATNNTTAASTAFVYAAINASAPNLSAYAPLNSPALTGTPTGPTAATATNNTQLATTAFVRAAIASYAPTPDLSGYVTLGTAQTVTGAKTFSAPITSPMFTVPNPGDSPYSWALYNPGDGVASTDLALTYGSTVLLTAGFGGVSFNAAPYAPTLATATNNQQLATTAFVRAAISAYAPNPNLSGYVTLGTAQTITGAKVFDRSVNVADANYELAIHNGAYGVRFHARLSAGSYSPAVSAGDSALIYTGSNTGAGSLVLAPWSNSTLGALRLSATGNSALYGALTVTGNISANGLTVTGAPISVTNNNTFIRTGVSGPAFSAQDNVGNKFEWGNSWNTQNDGIAWIYNRANADIVFGTNNTERGRIYASGALVWGTNITAAGFFRATGGANAYYCPDRTTARDWAWYASSDLIKFWNGSADVMAIDPNGRTMLKNANSTALTTQPRIFVQSTDPGAAATTNDLWFW